MCPDDDETLLGVSAAPHDTSGDAPTTRIDVGVPRRRPQLVLIVLSVAAAGFLLGIGAASVVPRSTTDVPAHAAQSIGPSGGIVRFDGGEIRVPTGALAQEQTISVYRSMVDRRVRIDPGGKAEPIVFEPGRLVAYRFEPSDITFDEPVQISFRLPTGADNGAVFARGTQGGIVLLEGTIDTDRGTATTIVRDFRFGGAPS